MKIIVAKKLGFCYGVKRAMQIAEDLSKTGTDAVTLGPIIHNNQVVAGLRSKGIDYVESLDDVPGETVIIRSHGVGPACYNRANEKNLKIIDATCPYVVRAQKEANRLVNEGKTVIIFGEKNHPEVRSIAEWAMDRAIVAETPADLANLPYLSEASVVSQTTFSQALFQEMLALVKDKVDHVDVHRTICNVTAERQNAVAELAKIADVIVVIGGRHSGNTRRLYELAKANGTPAYHIETAAELRSSWFQSDWTVGITAGASTPDWIIEEVLLAMDDMKTTFEEMDMNYDFHKGSIVEGTVVDLTDEEAYVSFGYKTEAVLQAREYSFPAPESMKDVLAVGDTVKAQITNAVKEDGTIYISKIKLDRLADWDIVEQALANDEPVEVEGIEAIKAGLLVQIKSLRGFIPLSQGDLRFVRSLSFLVGTTFQAKVLEVDRLKNRLVLSRKAMLEIHRETEMENMKEAYEQGTQLTGIVKKIMPYGAFIDVNGIEGLLHISDVAWNKIDKVEDVLEPNQEVNVIIKSFDPEKQRISFSRKDTLPDPCMDDIQNYAVGDTVVGKVVKLIDFGAIVELTDGLTGLLHISEITKDRSKKVGDVLADGDMVEVQIIGINKSRKRISFSLIQVQEHAEGATEEMPADEAPVQDVAEAEEVTAEATSDEE